MWHVIRECRGRESNPLETDLQSVTLAALSPRRRPLNRRGVIETLETPFRDRAPNLGGATSCGVRTSSAKLLVSTLRSIRHSCRGGSGIESEADAEGGSVDVPLASESAPRRPWGRITAVVVVALVAITAISIAVRQPNRAPRLSDVRVRSETATTAPPTPLPFTGHATDPDVDRLPYHRDVRDRRTP